MLRRAGFAYDYKDMATARMLVLTVIKANRKMAEINATLTPAREQIDKLHHIITLVELYAGHEERQGPQYKEALEEIERLQNQMARHQEKSGTLEDLDRAIEVKKAGIVAQEAVIADKAQQLHDLEARKDEILHALHEKNRELDDVRREQAQTLRENEDLQIHLDEVNDKIQSLSAENHRMRQTHRVEVTTLKDRLRMVEGGLLVEKLESEIAALRDLSQDYERQVEKERQARIAFEERVEIWIQNGDDLQKKVDFWKKKSALTYSYAAAACGLTALGGYGLAGLLSTTAYPVGWYFGVMMGIPAVIVGGVVGLHEGDGWLPYVKGAAVAAFAGGAMAVLGTVPIVASDENVRKEAENKIEAEKLKFLTQDCAASPCRIVKNADGGFSVEVLAKKYDGEVATFDFSKKGPPAHSRQIPLPSPQPAGAPK